MSRERKVEREFREFYVNHYGIIRLVRWGLIGYVAFMLTLAQNLGG
jgi:hypothetical protein